jgi:hypothetical protein
VRPSIRSFSTFVAWKAHGFYPWSNGTEIRKRKGYIGPFPETAMLFRICWKKMMRT